MQSRHKISHKVSIDVISYVQFSKASMKTTLVDGRFFVEFFAVLVICSSCGGLMTVHIFIAIRYV